MDPRAEVAEIPPRGYRWWYVDGLSADGQRGFTVIFLVGSVFSPTYTERSRRGPAPASDHVGVHVALYERGREVAWAMSEWGRDALVVDGRRVAIGRSSLEWREDGSIAGAIDERTAPVFWSYLSFGTTLRGRFELTPSSSVAPTVELGRSASNEAHLWQVRAPLAMVDVEFERPRFSLRGRGYHDTNWGHGRLEHAFKRWGWARRTDGDRAQILYAVEPREGSTHGFVVRSDRTSSEVATSSARFGEVTPHKWGLHAPTTFAVGDESAHVARMIDHAPFYARYVATLDGQEGVGEYLDLDRFARRGVQFLLHFRTQRRR